MSSNGHRQPPLNGRNGRNGRALRVDGRAFTPPAQNLLQIDTTSSANVASLTNNVAGGTMIATTAQVGGNGRGVIQQNSNGSFSIAALTLGAASAARSNRVRIHDVAARVVASPTTPPEFAIVGLPDLLSR